jgi:adenylate cyclase
MKALQKDRSIRYLSVQEVMVDLLAIKNNRLSEIADPASIHRASIAVLPFINMSADPENEYFSDGLSEELINALTHVEDIRVASRSLAFQFRGKAQDLREIADRLNVTTILEGSVRKSGNRLRITAQLTNSTDGFHIWSERYEREMADVFQIQDEIVRAIVDALSIKLTGKQRKKLIRTHTDNLEAYNLYLRGRHHSQKLSEQNVLRAIECFERAAMADSEYALSYSGIAECHVMLPFFSGTLKPQDAYQKARITAEKAISIDDSVAEAHAVLGAVNFLFDWNWSEAERRYQGALELNLNDAMALGWYSHYLMITNRPRQALEAAEKAVELDPLSPMSNVSLAWIYDWRREYDQAEATCRKGIELDPSFFGSYWTLGVVCGRKHLFDKSESMLKKAWELSESPVILANLAAFYGYGHREREAWELLDQLAKTEKTSYVPPTGFAMVHFSLKDKDTGFRYFEKAFEEHDQWLPYFLKLEPSHDSIRDDPRAQNLLRRIGL